MHKKVLIPLLMIITITLACSFPVNISLSNTENQPEIKLLNDLDPFQQINATPFQPYQFTPSIQPQSELVLDALVPNEGVFKPDGQINILLLGSDWRPNSGYRTDVLLLISVFTRQEQISLVSFPRDLWVQVPGVGEQRINITQAYGGFPLTIDTFEYNFGIHLDHYMMTNFNGFLSIIDTLGGIEINAAQNLSDRCDLSYAHGAWCSVGPGVEQLDSEMALWYVRSRYTSNDFDRTRRAQEVAEGIFKKMMSLDAVAKAPELYNLFLSSVVTDLSLGDIVALVKIAPKILSDPSRVHRYAIGTEHVTSYVIPSSGANVLIPKYDAIWQLLLTAIFSAPS